jgi:RNA polymerase sigma-70 factor (ECF subfamily)
VGRGRVSTERPTVTSNNFHRAITWKIQQFRVSSLARSQRGTALALAPVISTMELPMPHFDETDLVVRLRTGDDDAYEQLFRTHAGAMMFVARRFFGDTDEAAEAVQDAFVSAFKAMATFEGTAKLGTWLHRITVNACLLKLRGRKRSRLVPLEEGAATNASACDSGLSQAETCTRVRAGVEQLPEAYRTVIRLRDFEGLSTEETAARLGTNCGAVKTRLHRARQALKSVLESQFSNAV